MMRDVYEQALSICTALMSFKAWHASVAQRQKDERQHAREMCRWCRLYAVRERCKRKLQALDTGKR